MTVAHKVVLHFPPIVTEQPIIYMLMKDYNLAFNILRASIDQQQEGLMVLELSGEDADYQRAHDYLSGLGVRIQPLLQDIRRNDEKCTQCGACVGVCPPEALYIERPSMRVIFDPDKCVACGECVPTCPVKAMELHF
jgi:L-aspartate semialdehyde sulfurtransferase ferredoxin